MSRARFERLPQQRRDEILDIAARAFARSGYAEASYNQILEEAGLSKSSAYYLFESKADLYAAVMEREIQTLVAATSGAVLPHDIDSFWQSARAWLRSLLTFLAERPQTRALAAHYAEASRQGSVPNLDPAIEAALLDPLSALLASGLPLGAVRRDVDLELLAAMSNGALAALDRRFLPALAGMSPEEAERAIDTYIDTLDRLLSPSKRG